MILQSGDVLTISKEQAKVTGHVPAQGILVDGLGVGDVGNIVLRDRQHLSQNGLLLSLLHLTVIMGFFWQGQTLCQEVSLCKREREAHGRGKECCHKHIRAL